MKQFLFLLLFPAFAMAQYPGNANQKITLGEQTTADGLVYRGVASIDTVTATSKITRANKQDTSAFLLLDTVTNLLWHYKIGSNGWIQAGGSTLDTATMLLPYYRAGRNTIIQAADVPTLNQNTTGSAATLTTGRTIQTNLASTSSATFNGSANITPGVTGVLPVANGGTGLTTFTAANRIPYSTSATALTTNSNFTYDGNRLLIPQAIFNGETNYGYIFSAKASTSSGGAGIFIRGNQGGDNNLPTTFGYPYVNIGGFENKLNAIQTIGFGFTNGTGTYLSPAEIGYLNNSLSGYTNGHLVFATRESTSNVAPDEKMRITNAGEAWIGYKTDQGAYLLQVKDSVYIGGNVSASAYTTRSDYDLKDEIQNITYGINEVMQMQPVKYTYKSNGSTQLGFIAQDLGVITPEVVSFEDKMSVYYNALIPILTKAIQEQNALIKALEQRILNLENK